MPIIITGRSPHDRSGELLAQGFSRGFQMAMEAGRMTLAKEQLAQRQAEDEQRRTVLGELQSATGEDDVVSAYLQAQGNPSGAAMYAGLPEGPDKRRLRSTLLEQAQAEKDAEETQGTLSRFQAAEQAGVLPEGSSQLAFQGIQTGGVTRKELEDELYNAQRRHGMDQAKAQASQAKAEELDQEIATKAPRDPEVLTERAVLQTMLETDPTNEHGINQAIVRIKRMLVDPEVEAEILRERMLDGDRSLDEGAKMEQVLGTGEAAPLGDDSLQPAGDERDPDAKRWGAISELRQHMLNLPAEKRTDAAYRRELRKKARELALGGTVEELHALIRDFQGDVFNPK